MVGEQKRRTVQLNIGGRQYRVVTTASDSELRRLVARVEERLREVAGNRGPTPDAILLTALSLAHDVETQRARADRILAQAKRAGGDLLLRVEEALGDEPTED